LVEFVGVSECACSRVCTCLQKCTDPGVHVQGGVVRGVGSRAWFTGVVRGRGAWAWCVGVVRGRGVSACTQACVCHVGLRVRTDRIVAVFCLVLHVGGLDRNTTGLLLGCLVNIVELQLLARSFQVKEHLPDSLKRQCPSIFTVSSNY
jgi:hypothetical protein